MISFKNKDFRVENNNSIKVVKAFLPLNCNIELEIELISWGAGIRAITFVDHKKNIKKLLTLSYMDVLESCRNNSLSGLTIGPNAGRLKANEHLTLKDGNLSLDISLPANEDDTEQVHGGKNNLARTNWNLQSIHCDEDKSKLEIRFTTSQNNGLDGWPGNRIYEVNYTISENGYVKIDMSATSDELTYINMTNHTYWLRDGLKLLVNSNRYIENKANFLPEKVSLICNEDKYLVGPNDILNNAFIFNNSIENILANMNFEDINLNVNLSASTPALVVYTGDYLDNKSVLSNNMVSLPTCAIALEPQELFPMTKTTLCTPTLPFSRTITYEFLWEE